MPVSIPTAYAAHFVLKAPLIKRINVLKTSYKIQVAGLSTFSIINIDKVAIFKPLISFLSF